MSEMCEHRDIIGHEWSSTCQQCGKTWYNRIPEGVLVNMPTELVDGSQETKEKP